MIPWSAATFVGFDVETSGKYPLEAEICEIAAVKWQNNKIIDQFQTLVMTERRMSDEVIKIHNITNEMLVGAPSVGSAIVDFHKFIGDAYLIAHHAPFDLGFIAPEFERARLPLPRNSAFCSSLLSRKAFPESENHKLQTLIRFFNLKQGTAHRALDDAEACLFVGLRVFEKIGAEATLEQIFEYQEAKLPWSAYSISVLKAHPVYSQVVKALETRAQLQITYAGGSRPGQPRTVYPLGLVRNPLDDYLVATEDLREIPKRYFLNKITGAAL
jgi:DNA polymerase-3 subunit epsilon